MACVYVDYIVEYDTESSGMMEKDLRSGQMADSHDLNCNHYPCTIENTTKLFAQLISFITYH